MQQIIRLVTVPVRRIRAAIGMTSDDLLVHDVGRKAHSSASSN